MAGQGGEKFELDDGAARGAEVWLREFRPGDVNYYIPRIKDGEVESEGHYCFQMNAAGYPSAFVRARDLKWFEDRPVHFAVGGGLEPNTKIFNLSPALVRAALMTAVNNSPEGVKTYLSALSRQGRIPPMFAAEAGEAMRAADAALEVLKHAPKQKPSKPRKLENPPTADKGAGAKTTGKRRGKK